MRKSLAALAVAVAATTAPLAVPSSPRPAIAAGYLSGQQVVNFAMQYLGYPYTTVGNSPSEGFSCIGFVSYVYQSLGVPLPDDLWDAQAYAPAVSFDDLEPGDVLWFANTVWPGLSHTAIYIGNGKFINAEWYNRGVVVSSFTNDPVDGDYWMQHYMGASRPWGPIADAVSSGAAPAAPAPAAAVNLATPAPPTAPQPQLASGPQAFVNVMGLRLRKRPSLRAPAKSVANAGTKVIVLKQYRKWYWVQLANGNYGWIRALGIGLSPVHHHALAPAAMPLVHVRVDGLNVRQRPGLKAPVVAVAYQGQPLLVARHYHRWLWVVTQDGVHGWVNEIGAGGVQVAARADQNAALLRRGVSLPAVNDLQQATPPQVSGAHMKFVHDAVVGGTAQHPGRWTHARAAVRLRQKPGRHGRILGLVTPGVRLHVLGRYHHWAFVRLPHGRHGWVYAAFLSQ